MERFLLGLLIVSTITSLTTEALKVLLAEHDWLTSYPNTLVGMVSVVIGGFGGFGYCVCNGTAFSGTVAVYIALLIFLSWLCAMLGYDKVVQTLAQLKAYSTEE